MPDIVMCQNKDCPYASKCYRQMAEPNSYRQAYSYFEPNDKGECEWFTPLAHWRVAEDDEYEYDE